VAKKRPACPRHPGSKVWLDGYYGAPTHKRQRYKCTPSDGGGPRHVFTETLPRLHGGIGECLECERHYDKHEGPTTGRRFHYSTRDVAYALIEVGKGHPDRVVGRRVRDRADRGWARDGNTVADWVELYAPAVFAPHAPTEWPRVVALDALPFAIKREDDDGNPVQGGAIAFNVFGAYGWDSHGKGSLLALRAAPNFGFNQGFPYWANFLEDLRKELSGDLPYQIVSDQDGALLDAIDAVWPAADGPSPLVYVCHWHLGERLRKIVREAGIPYGEPLRDQLEHNAKRHDCKCVFCGDGARWAAYEQIARKRKIRPLTNWMNYNGNRIEWQLENRRKHKAKTSTGPLEQIFSTVRSAFSDRRGLIHNRERLDRRLMLMQLEINGLARETRYAKVIRAELLQNGGFGAARYVVDDKNGSSLRVFKPKTTP
jgi:hypothetical protein